MDHPPPNETQEYLVRHQEQVLGPFGTDFVEAMIMSGVYPATVNVQKVGTTVWLPFSNEETRLKALSTERDQDRTYLNRTYLNRTSQYSVDAFNRKVGQVNSLNDRVQALVNDFNRDVDAFNAELARVGTLIR